MTDHPATPPTPTCTCGNCDIDFPQRYDLVGWDCQTCRANHPPGRACCPKALHKAATPPTGGLSLNDVKFFRTIYASETITWSAIADAAEAYLRLRGELAAMRVEMAKLADGTTPASVAYAAIHGALGDIMRRAAIPAEPTREGR